MHTVYLEYFQLEESTSLDSKAPISVLTWNPHSNGSIAAVAFGDSVKGIDVRSFKLVSSGCVYLFGLFHLEESSESVFPESAIWLQANKLGLFNFETVTVKARGLFCILI